jgi:hypothetical protein
MTGSAESRYSDTKVEFLRHGCDIAKVCHIWIDLPDLSFFGYPYGVVLIFNQQRIGITCPPLKNLPDRT